MGSTSVDINAIPTPYLVVAAVIAVLAVKYYLYVKGKVHLPGPVPLPIVGNLPQLGRDAALTFHEWSKTYGDVFKVTLGEREVVIINSAQATKELLSDQGGAYMSRPIFHNYHSVLGSGSTAGMTIGTSPWDESCKRKRRAAATALNKTNVQAYVPIIERETLALVEDLYVNGKGGKLEVDPATYMSRFALNTSLSVNYGCRLDGLGDELLGEIISTESGVSDIRSVTSAWSDYVPLLRYLPKAASKAEEIKRRRDRYMGLLLEDLKDRIAKRTDVPCITGSILKDPEANVSALELSSICLSMVSAGLDTLGNTLIWTVGFLAQHPEIWEKCYQEVVEIYGDEVPDIDSESVEYVTATYREALRYFSVLKLSLPRATLTDSEYRGVTIPGGTTVFLNAWGVHHDRKRYGDVENFRPERFLKAKEDMNTQTHYSFGAGRRMCAGTHLANREMYSALAKMVYFFKLVPGDVPYDMEPATATANPTGLSSKPYAYKMRFVARDPAALEAWIHDEKNRNDLKVADSIGAKKPVAVAA